MSQIPNGRSHTCDSCHGAASLLPRDLTPFGADVNRTLSGDNVDWSQLWNLDSDGDGLSNGLELGDPSGQWRRGEADPDAPTSNPGVPNQGICGNGTAEPDEDCDGADMRGQSCMSLEAGNGTLSCHPLCKWDLRECGFCGDGYHNPLSEDCDGDRFPAELTCEAFGFLRGELSCTAECEVDPSTCTDEAPAVCGDGVISTGEYCDGDNFGTIDCVRLAFAGGTLECTDECRWEASGCIFEDGTRVGDEERAMADDGSLPGPDAGSGGATGDAGTAPGGTEGPGAVTGEGKACSHAAASPPRAPTELLLFGLLLATTRRRRHHKQPRE